SRFVSSCPLAHRHRRRRLARHHFGLGVSRRVLAAPILLPLAVLEIDVLQGDGERLVLEEANDHRDHRREEEHEEDRDDDVEDGVEVCSVVVFNVHCFSRRWRRGGGRDR
ncbi:hypothetical protein PENTCL1PPCAC_3959, partial [Pristionchus entomophagus]